MITKNLLNYEYFLNFNVDYSAKSKTAIEILKMKIYLKINI